VHYGGWALTAELPLSAYTITPTAVVPLFARARTNDKNASSMSELFIFFPRPTRREFSPPSPCIRAIS
jgi:hypothetical protein